MSKLNADLINSLVKRIKDGEEYLYDQLHKELKPVIETARKDINPMLDKEYAFDIAYPSIWEAVEKFDCGKFATFVRKYIEGAFKKEKGNKDIKYPEKIKRCAPTVIQIIKDYHKNYPVDEPTNEEIKETLSSEYNVTLSIDEIIACRSYYLSSMSLNEEYMGAVSEVIDNKSIDSDEYNKFSEIVNFDKEEKEVYYYKIFESRTLKEIAELKHKTYSVIQRIYDTCQAKIKKKRKALLKEGVDVDAIIK